VIGQEVPLLDQGSIQFILLGVMILVVLFVLWITIAK
jgi:Mg2+ and Co2+ transporter CorA